MGITAFDIKLLEKYIDKYKPDNVLEFGSQNLYITSTDKPPFASEWYRVKGLEYECVDLGGDNDSLVYDLSKPLMLSIHPEINNPVQFNLITDFGFSEHVVKMNDHERVTYDGGITSIYPKGEINIDEGYYNCWLNKHSLCKIGGLIISENPESKSWPSHGYSYLKEKFYTELAKITDYEILELGRHPAMGNDKNGWNVYSVMRKHSEVFPTFEIFNSLPIYKS